MGVLQSLPLEESLLVLLNLARPSESDLAEIGKLAALKSLDWLRVFELAKLNAVLPLALCRLKAERKAALMPSDILKEWEAEAALIHKKNVKRSKWAKKLLDAMDKSGVQVIVLNGSMLAEEIYENRS